MVSVCGTSTRHDYVAEARNGILPRKLPHDQIAPFTPRVFLDDASRIAAEELVLDGGVVRSLR